MKWLVSMWVNIAPGVYTGNKKTSNGVRELMNLEGKCGEIRRLNKSQGSRCTFVRELIGEQVVVSKLFIRV